jgi:hypothetical protein
LEAKTTHGSGGGSNGSKPHNFPFNQAVSDPRISHLGEVGHQAAMASGPTPVLPGQIDIYEALGEEPRAEEGARPW